MRTVRDIILREDISVDISSTIAYTLEMMAKNKQGVIVVLSKSVPVGIITERDVLNQINNTIDFEVTIDTILRFNHLITINIKRSIDYALHVLIDNNIRRLIIVDDINNFEGVVTQDIIVKHLEDDTFKTNLLISNFMKEHSELITVNKNKSIKEAFTIMNNNDIGSIIAVDDHLKPVGIITEKDSVYIAKSRIDLELPISSVMKHPVVTICESKRVKDVVELMEEKDIRRVLVLKQDSLTPHSIMSIRDIAYNLKGNYGQILESKLKNVKNTLNYIGESVLEVYEDNNEQVIQWINDTALKNFGNIVDKNLNKLIDPDMWKDIYADVKTKDECTKHKINIKNMYFEMMCSYHYTNKKEALLIILRDISEFEHAVIDANKKNEQIQQELDILQGVIDQQKSIVLVTDGFEVISANRSLFDFFNVKSLAEFIEKHKNISDTYINHKNFFSLEDKSLNWIDEITKLDIKNRIVSILDLNDFEPKAFTVQVNPLSSDVKNYAVTLTDITDIKLESQQYHFHATHDALTGIYNRSYYFEKIANEIEQSRRYKTTFCIILFDIDFFKKFNDNYGHLKGDEVLVKLSQTIQTNTRVSDTFARWGGEEFIILLEKTTLEKAELIAEHFRKLIENMHIKDIPQVTSSFGVTQYQDGDTDNCILKRADDALYEAKEAGRNCVVVK
ncbi:MAG: diguanylate cyclase [Campylobacterota bacterium]|nr:diguanylate cyclase [Campylobacterota bacterium]